MWCIFIIFFLLYIYITTFHFNFTCFTLHSLPPSQFLSRMNPDDFPNPNSPDRCGRRISAIRYTGFRWVQLGSEHRVQSGIHHRLVRALIVCPMYAIKRWCRTCQCTASSSTTAPGSSWRISRSSNEGSRPWTLCQRGRRTPLVAIPRAATAAHIRWTSTRLYTRMRVLAQRCPSSVPLTTKLPITRGRGRWRPHRTRPRP